MSPPEHPDAEEEESVTNETDNGRNENNLDDVAYGPSYGDNGFQGPLTESGDGNSASGANSAGSTVRLCYSTSRRFLQLLLLFL